MGCNLYACILLQFEQDIKTECIKEETEEPQDLATLIKRPDFPKFEIITENIHLTERFDVLSVLLLNRNLKNKRNKINFVDSRSKCNPSTLNTQLVNIILFFVFF